MKLWIRVLLGVVLSGFGLLVFLKPHAMLAPGNLIEGHANLTEDCFACHAPWRGVSSARCTQCHKPADIGRVTTQSMAVALSQNAARFHQELTGADCVACHSDHAGVIRLRASTRFDHAMTKPASRSQCSGCHQPPRDALHQDLRSQCSSCHSVTAWRPATFDHQRYFVLDGDHDVSCVTCHTTKSYREYSCYGCHEHTVDRIRRAHVEEGIHSFENCVKCHRSAQKRDAD